MRLHGAVRIKLSYNYDLAPGKTLADVNMQAQGDLLADHFGLKFMHRPQVMWARRHAGQLALYERVLAGFLADPARRDNLPHGWARRSVHPPT